MITMSEGGSLHHSMEGLLSDHQVALSVVCIVNLVPGLQLATNMLWHLQAQLL